MVEQVIQGVLERRQLRNELRRIASLGEPASLLPSHATGEDVAAAA